MSHRTVRPPTTATKSEKTRHRILNTAAAAYREGGLDGVGVRDIMKRAGLTQGGFYFHFPDKDALFTEASRAAAMAHEELYVSLLKDAPPGKELQTFIGYYLSAEHRDHPETGCLMTTLASEVARRGRKLRKEFTNAAFIPVKRLAPYLPGATAEERWQRAGLLLSSMAGVLMVSRVLPDPIMSDSLLAQAREFFCKSFSDN